MVNFSINIYRDINPIYTIGVYRTNNNCNTWEPINNGFLLDFTNGGTTRRIICNPDDPDILLVATTKGIYRTENATDPNHYDVVWDNIFTGLPSQPDLEFRGLEFKPDNPEVIYASGRDIYISIDGGDLWESLTGPLTGLDLTDLPNPDFSVNRINIAVSNDKPNRLYAYIEGSLPCLDGGKPSSKEGYYIYMYEDGSWNYKYYDEATICGPHLQSHQVSPAWIAIAASPDNGDHVYFGCTTVYGTENIQTAPSSVGARSEYWGEGCHPDIHCLVFEPNISNPRLFCGNHGGVSVKTFPSTTGGWEYKNDGLENAIIWAFDDSEMNDFEIVIANQDRGTNGLYKENGSLVWYFYQGGDGYCARINETDPDQLYTSNNGSFQRLSYILKSQQESILPYELPNYIDKVRVPTTFPMINHPNDKKLFFGFTEIFRKDIEKAINIPPTPWQDVWVQESDLKKSIGPDWMRQITELSIAESNPNYIYAVTGGQTKPEAFGPWALHSRIFKSTTGGIDGEYGSPSVHTFDTILYPGYGVTGDTLPIITGLVIDPENSDRIWVCYTGYVKKYKVWHYETASATWINDDPNLSLKNLPINGIVYQKGTNDRLYIATDAGIYVKDASMTNWEKYGDFPNVRALELKINPCNNKLRVATFGRGVWEGDLLPPTETIEEVIHTETVWEKGRALFGDLRITTGGELTIKGTVNMPPDSRVIVEPGGELIIDQGKITNGCGNYWLGIEVWGNSALSQIPIGVNQGKIQIINGGTIENAIIGILVAKRSDEDYNQYDPRSAGGIVLCQNANFINNKIGVLFTNYSYPNHSSFKKTIFKTDAELIDSQPPTCFVKLLGVNEINFEGCTFQNTRNWSETTLTNRGMGIYSDNSKFHIDESCLTQVIPCPGAQPSLVEGLTFGIYATNSGTANNALVEHTNFNDNVKGLYLSGFSEISHAEVTQNTFRVFRPGEEWIDCYGMYLNDCSGYHVEENVFYSEGIPYDGIGLIVNNSFINDEKLEIYRNQFSNLMYGSIASHRNRNPLSRVGLCYKCNKFNDNYEDIAITSDPGIVVAPNFGIAENQGSPSSSPNAPAGNMFQLLPPSGHYDINNAFSNINYYYHQINTSQYRLNPTGYTNGLVTPSPVFTPFIEEDACPPGLDGGGGGSSEDQTEMIYAEYQSDSLNILLSQLVDGGSTEILNYEVETSTPPEAISTWSELITHSPFISDSVIQTSIEKEDVLNNAMIRDVMVANTHSAKSIDLINMLENRVIPMPDYMISEILQGEDSISAKENFEATIAFWNTRRSDKYHKLIRHFKNNNYNLSTNDSLISLLKQRNTLSSWYSIASWYAARNNFDSVNAILNQIASVFTLTGDHLAQHQDYISYYNILNQVLADTISLYNLSSDIIAELNNILNSNNQLPGVFSRNLLLAAGELTYTEPIILPDEGLKSSKRDKYRGAKPPLEVPNLKVYPNPAKGYFIVEYHLDQEPTNCFIEILDVSGKKISNIQLLGKENQEIVPINDYPTGTYLISLFADGKSVDYIKLTIIN